MTAFGEALLTRAFGEPTGLLGHLGGRLMAKGNGPTERHMIDLAGLRADNTVVLIGPGPGIGVQAAVTAGASRVIAIDPSPIMLAACRRRCAPATHDPAIDLEFIEGTVANTSLTDGAADVVISVNNIFIWPDRAAGLVELYRILRPGGRLLVSAHEQWLPGGREGLAADVRDAGFADEQTWTWQPPGRGARPAAQLRATRAG